MKDIQELALKVLFESIKEMSFEEFKQAWMANYRLQVLMIVKQIEKRLKDTAPPKPQKEKPRPQPGTEVVWV